MNERVARISEGAPHVGVRGGCERHARHLSRSACRDDA
nr:MAG TPA: hypothetical protein [Caudoviricetes sp.]